MDRAGYRKRYHDHLMLLLPYLASSPRRDVDGGAYCGWFAEELIPYFREIEMFEPSADCAPFLTAMAVAQWPAHGTTVNFHPQALGDTSALLTLANAESKPTSYFYTKSPGGSYDMLPLDQFGWADVDFIKLNIEGAELLALQGTEETIRQSWPVLFLEVKGYGTRFGYTSEGIHAFLVELGYAQVGRKKGMRLYVHK